MSIVLRATTALMLCALVSSVLAGEAVTVILTDGRELEGVLVGETEDMLILRNADGNRWELPRASVKEIRGGGGGERPTGPGGQWPEARPEEPEPAGEPPEEPGQDIPVVPSGPLRVEGQEYTTRDCPHCGGTSATPASCATARVRTGSTRS